jgi:type IV pilus assembly protein PilN
MIRINLLGAERQKARKTTATSLDAGQRITAACSLVLLLGIGGIGWWYWSLQQASATVDADIVQAQQQAAQLRSLLREVEDFEARRSQLQQRVALIEQLRSGQSVPVQLLDHVSRSLPDMLWLTSLQQDGAAVTIEGRSTTLIGLSDFVGNLGNTAVLGKPIEIVNSQLESQTAAAGAPPVELIKFTVKAQLAGAAKPAPPAGRGRGAAPGGAR